MTATSCYAMVRGSTIRVTGLTKAGRLPTLARYAVSRSVAEVRIDEVSDAVQTDTLRDERGRMAVNISGVTDRIGYTADVSFRRVDPDLISLMTGVPVVTNAAGDVVGFDLNTRLPAAAFALEVWSRLDRSGSQYGYTIFPFLRGGYLSGFVFDNGAVTFTLKGARTGRSNGWGRGPFDIFGVDEPLRTPVSRDIPWLTTITTLAPPIEQNGAIDLIVDTIDGGTANLTTADSIDGEWVVTSPDIVNGGSAA